MFSIKGIIKGVLKCVLLGTASSTQDEDSIGAGEVLAR